MKRDINSFYSILKRSKYVENNIYNEKRKKKMKETKKQDAVSFSKILQFILNRVTDHKHLILLTTNLSSYEIYPPEYIISFSQTLNVKQLICIIVSICIIKSAKPKRYRIKSSPIITKSPIPFNWPNERTQFPSRLSACMHLRSRDAVERERKRAREGRDKGWVVVVRRGEGGTAKKKRLKRGKVSDEIASTLETCSLKRSGSRMHGIRRKRAETVSF